MESLTRCGHAGGKKILQRVAGKDASKQFWKYHNEGILKKYQKQLQIGSLDTKPKPAAAPAPAPKKEAPKPKPAAAAAAAAPTEEAEALEPFGEQIPFSDPSWYQGVSRTQSRAMDRSMTGANHVAPAAPLPILQRDTCCAPG
jgi:hypothetical protein